ncbi:uncharacterized protein TRIADDRAFT_62561 [Trichoplax adhaerens]|uniref:Uncharacterized protein n=1 Tax=Trichoplax adhaerens TaxID=10228 RepID=B3SE61_TRIAD|nr:predicted protein [Trichoplax adhaerens]EDV18984.1 predicted protein [Trichoplax adhaerens]|eukprot:XP_002118530.1 predicted protein [Trichoplax adhaerens]
MNSIGIGLKLKKFIARADPLVVLEGGLIQELARSISLNRTIAFLDHAAIALRDCIDYYCILYPVENYEIKKNTILDILNSTFDALYEMSQTFPDEAILELEDTAVETEIQETLYGLFQLIGDDYLSKIIGILSIRPYVMEVLDLLLSVDDRCLPIKVLRAVIEEIRSRPKLIKVLKNNYILSVFIFTYLIYFYYLFTMA